MPIFFIDWNIFRKEKSMRWIDKVNVRFACDEDLAGCTKLDNIASEEIIQRKINLNEIIIAELKKNVIGYLRLEYLWSRIPYIALIVVQEQYRSQGVGKALLTFLEKFLSSEGHNILLSSSQVNEPAPQMWHRKMGFEECGILAGINEGGIGEVFFCKVIL